MMRKNCNPIFFNVRPKSLTWKLGIFFSLLSILFSSHLFALNPNNFSEKEISTTLGGTESESKIYISEGTVVFGMDNIYHQQAEETRISKKTTSGKTTKIKAKEKSKKIENKSNINKDIKPKKIAIYKTLSKNSEDFFTISKNSAKVGIISSSSCFKLALLNSLGFLIIFSLTAINSLYIFSSFILVCRAGSVSFTRPPPNTYSV